MFKKSLMVLMAILFSLASSAWADSHTYSDLEKKIEELSQAVQKLEGMIKDLSFQVQQSLATATIVKEISFELKKTESAVRDLAGVNKKVHEEIQPRLLTLEGTIQGVAASFRERFDIFQGRLFDLETTVQGLDARLKTVEGQLRELLALERQLNQLTKRVDALEQQAAKMPPHMPEAAKVMMRLQELADRLQKLEEQILTDLTDQINRNRTRIAALEINKANAEEVEALRARVMQLEEQLETQIEEVKSQATLITALAGVGLVASLLALATIFGVI